MSVASQKTIAQGEQQALMTPLFVIRKATIGSLRQAVRRFNERKRPRAA